MSKMKRLWVLTLMLAMFIPSFAGSFKFGPRLGVAVNSLHFDKTTFDSDNRAGFTGGLQAEFTVPVIGVGADLSVMYVHRNSKFMDEQNAWQNAKSDYIEIPLNLKYKLTLPAISKIIAPYVFTGPSFSFLASKKAISDLVEAKKCDIAWNFGFGVELIQHLQVGASYGLGMTKALHYVGFGDGNSSIVGKNRYWTITAAWLF